MEGSGKKSKMGQVSSQKRLHLKQDVVVAAAAVNVVSRDDALIVFPCLSDSRCQPVIIMLSVEQTYLTQCLWCDSSVRFNSPAAADLAKSH